MHTHSLDRPTHSHAFLGERHDENERRTWIVVGLTLVMMVGEIAGGTVFGSLGSRGAGVTNHPADSDQGAMGRAASVVATLGANQG